MSCFKESDGNTSVKTHLSFMIDDTRTSEFFQLLQRGFMLKTQVSCSIKRFLCEQIGLSPEYIAEKIQTVFLDGRPVDDLDSAIIKDGSRLALSAAMPGLVGATMRRGGIYSSFRSTITYNERGTHYVTGEGCVHIKLFNLLMKELGPDFLKRGIYLKSSHLEDFLSTQPLDFWQGCKKILLNENPVGPDLLQKEDWLSHHDMVYLSIVIPG